MGGSVWDPFQRLPLLHVLQPVDGEACPKAGWTSMGDSLGSSWGSNLCCPSWEDWWGWLPAHSSRDPSVGWL